MNLVWGFVIAIILVASVVGVENSWALKSQGVTQTGTNLGKICGVDFCDTPKQIDTKISLYLDDLGTSNIDETSNQNLDDLPYITKTSSVSKDLRLIHYSDGGWQLIGRSTYEGLKQSYDESGKPVMEFGGIVDLGSDFEEYEQESVGSLSISETSIFRPLADKVEQIQIYGNVGERNLHNVLITIDFPHKDPQDLIMPVDEFGNFDIQLNIDKMTEVGYYEVSAQYAQTFIGSVDFDILDHEISTLGDVEKINTITLSSDRIKIPSSNAQSFIIQVSGTLADYHKGNFIELTLETENGDAFTRKVPASRDGTFSTFVNITPEFPEGSHSVVMRYLGEEIARTSIIGLPESVTLR